MNFFNQTIREQIHTLFRGGIYMFLVGSVWATFHTPSFPDPSIIEPELQTEPIQTETEREPFTYEYKDTEYFVEPIYDYELWGMVVSHNDEYSFWDKLLPNILGARIKDLCVVWGTNTENKELISDINFWNENYTCWYQTHDNQAYSWFDGAKLSNNHVITDNLDIKRTILRSNVGDQIRLKGSLASYGYADTNKLVRSSSTVRTDTGNGACETIFVDEFEIIKKNPSILSHFILNSFRYLLLIIIVKIIFAFACPKPR